MNDNKTGTPSREILFRCLLGAFLVVTLVALFGALGRTEVCHTDEATYGVNAYEMLKTGSFWAHSLRYKLDYYNSKPPLLLWFIMLGYRIFGYNPLGLRFFSAVFGLLTCIISIAFALDSGGKMKALLFAAFFPACGQLFRYHMLRTGDADSIFVFFVMVGIVALYLARRSPDWLLLFGAAVGLGFMTKSSHVLTLLAVGFLYIPAMVKHYGIKKAFLRYLGAAGVCAAIILPWAVIRYRLDGLAFFKAMFIGETTGRVRSNLGNSLQEYLAYGLQLIREPVCLISILLILSAIITAAIRKDINKKNLLRLVLAVDDKGASVFLEICLAAVTIFLFSALKAVLDWYIYPAYIPLMLLGADSAVYLFSRAKASRLWYAALLLSSAALAVLNIQKYPWVSSGGSPRIALYSDLTELSEKDITGLRGRRAYIENSFNIAKPRDIWEHDNIFYAYATLDLLCCDGGVEGFLADEDSDALLILDKTLWEEYAPVLTGHVILEDNTYLVFSKALYGE